MTTEAESKEKKQQKPRGFMTYYEIPHGKESPLARLMRRALSQYREKNGLKSYRELSEATGVPHRIIISLFSRDAWVGTPDLSTVLMVLQRTDTPIEELCKIIMKLPRVVVKKKPWKPKQ